MDGSSCERRQSEEFLEQRDSSFHASCAEEGSKGKKTCWTTQQGPILPGRNSDQQHSGQGYRRSRTKEPPHARTLKKTKGCGVAPYPGGTCAEHIDTNGHSSEREAREYPASRSREACYDPQSQGHVLPSVFLVALCSSPRMKSSQQRFQEVSRNRQGFRQQSLAALEDVVSDPSAVLYYRMYSWWILVQCWGTLRFSDHRGLRPADVLLDSEGFMARLTRSKSIGSHRAVTMRLVVICKTGTVCCRLQRIVSGAAGEKS